MAWVKFKRKYNWRVPGKGVSFISYPAGGAFSVKRQCADDATAAGAAERHPSPRKSVDPNGPSNGADPEGA